MKLKVACFVIIPLIFFGCGTYFHITKSEDPIDFGKMPENKVELQEQVDLFNGRKG